MKPGDTIVLHEGTSIVDAYGVNYLPSGTQGVLEQIDGPLLSMRCKGELCEGIPVSSAHRKDDDKEAAA